MSSPLASLPVDRRRRLAATLGLFAALFVAIGAVSAAGTSSPAAPVFCVIALAVALLLGLMAWGVVRSVQIDRADAQFGTAVRATMAPHGGMCGCGHQHDPDELVITDAEPGCDHAGAADCSHDCDTCVLAAMRPSPSATRSDRLQA